MHKLLAVSLHPSVRTAIDSKIDSQTVVLRSKLLTHNEVRLRTVQLCSGVPMGSQSVGSGGYLSNLNII